MGVCVLMVCKLVGFDVLAGVVVVLDEQMVME